MAPLEGIVSGIKICTLNVKSSFFILLFSSVGSVMLYIVKSAAFLLMLSFPWSLSISWVFKIVFLSKLLFYYKWYIKQYFILIGVFILSCCLSSTGIWSVGGNWKRCKVPWNCKKILSKSWCFSSGIMWSPPFSMPFI